MTSYYWLFIALPLIRTASLQNINRALPADSVRRPKDHVLDYPLTNSDYYNPDNDVDQEESTDFNKNQQIQAQNLPDESPNSAEENAKKAIDKEVNMYMRSDGVLSSNPYIMQKMERSKPPLLFFDKEEDGLLLDKKSFSPWRGKKDSWNRNAHVQEPSMPKRVRFSTWGGKRSNHVIIKPGVKGTKIIFMNSLPEITRIFSRGRNLFNVEAIAPLDKRHPLHILSLSTVSDNKHKRSKLPFKAFIESTKFYKPGHPYAEVLIKNDRKRKSKFSAWGGKRAPPLIGPIWNVIDKSLLDEAVEKLIRETNLYNETRKK